MNRRESRGRTAHVRAGVHLWGPLWLPGAEIVGRVWGTLDGGAEVEVAPPNDEVWLPFDRVPDYATRHLGVKSLWELTVTQLTEVEPLARAVCRRWALAEDEDFLHDPDEVGYRARHLTLVNTAPSVIEVRFVLEPVARARRAALQVYERWANMPRITGAQLASLKEDLDKVRESFDSAAGEPTSLPADMSVESLTRSAWRLAKLLGPEDTQSSSGPEQSPEALPIGKQVKEGPPRPSPIGIGELLFFGRPVGDPGKRSARGDRQLMLPLLSVRRGEPNDPEWDRLLRGLADGSVRAVMEDVSLRRLVYHNRTYRPTDRRTASSVARYMRLIASGERPWLRVRRVGLSHVVSQEYALLKAYRDSGIELARCLILTEDRPG